MENSVVSGSEMPGKLYYNFIQIMSLYQLVSLIGNNCILIQSISCLSRQMLSVYFIIKHKKKMLYKYGFVNNLLRNYNKNTKITSERIRTRSISYVY